MNVRLQKIKARYYTCYEMLGPLTVNLSIAFNGFFARKPLKADPDCPLVETAERVSFRHSNMLNNSQYSSLAFSDRLSQADNGPGKQYESVVNLVES